MFSKASEEFLDWILRSFIIPFCKIEGRFEFEVFRKVFDSVYKGSNNLE